MVLPAGFGLPPIPYLIGLTAGLGIVIWLLFQHEPDVSQATVLSFTPWMLLGASLHALYQLTIVSDVLRPLFGTPAIYATTVVLLGLSWLLSLQITAEKNVPVRLAIVGTCLLIIAIGWYLVTLDRFRFAWPVVGLIGTFLLTGASWFSLQRVAPMVTARTGWVGIMVVLAHILDGVTTAIGYDVLGYGERTPASRLILELGSALPTADVIGAGWLFVSIKLLLAMLVVWLFREFVIEEPRRGFLLLGFIAAVGLGPGWQNLLLYIAG